jgi:serine/tyrosine/threonine adenylyltransferase
VFPGPEPFEAGLKRYVDVFVETDRRHTAAKLGLRECRDEDLELMDALRGL